MKRLSLFVLFASTALFGCAARHALLPYVAAPEGAKIRFAGPQTSAITVQVRGYPSGKCESPVDLGVLDGLPPKEPAPAPTFPGAGEYRDGSHFERVIPIDSPYMVSMGARYSFGVYAGSGPTRWECAVTFNFTPKKGGTYEARYLWEGDRCKVEVYAIRSVGEGKLLRQQDVSARSAEVCKAGIH